jgi:hypothetical protein
MAEYNRITLSENGYYQDRPIKELVSGLGRDMGTLVRQEIELAKAELTEKASHVAKGAATIGAGAFLVYAGVLALAAALALIGIAIGIAAWASASLVAIILLIVGYATMSSGRRHIARGSPALSRTKQNAKETVHHLKEQLR